MRQLVEGQTLGAVAATVPDTDPVVTLPAPGSDAVYRDDQNNDDFSTSLPGVLVNLDPITAHTFQIFMRGTDVPNGELNLTGILAAGAAVATVPALESGPVTPVFPLIGDQRYEIEMQEVVVTTAPEFTQSFRDNHSPLDKLKVVKSVPGTLVTLFDDQADLVIEAPDGSSVREVFFTAAGSLNVGTHIYNADSETHTFTVLYSPDGGITEFVLATIAVPTLSTLAEELTSGGVTMVASLNLSESDSAQLIIRDATAVTTTSPIALVAFTDHV